MTSSLAKEEEVDAAAVVAVAEATVLATVTIAKVVDAEAREEGSSPTMTSLLCEQYAPAHAALKKVNVKCLSHVTHAFRCE